jgi:hypothetical protein
MNCCFPSQSQACSLNRTDKVILASAIVLAVTVVALAVILAGSANGQNVAFLYADCAVGGAALLALVASGAYKIYRGRSEHTTSSEPTAAQVDLDNLDEKKLNQAVVDEWGAIHFQQQSNKIRVLAKGTEYVQFTHSDFPTVSNFIIGSSKDCERITSAWEAINTVLRENHLKDTVAGYKVIKLTNTPNNPLPPKDGWTLLLVTMEKDYRNRQTAG